MKASREYSEVFELAFSKPNLYTDRGHNVWADLELTSDILAGPLYSILKACNCDYVYSDKENRFPDVTDFKSFQNWANDVANFYKKGILAFDPQNPNETKDKESLLTKANAMLRIVVMAEHEICKNSHT